MGVDEPFAAHAASTPLDVTVSAAPDIKFRKIDLFDGDRRLGEFTDTPPQLTLNHLAPGVCALIAAGTLESGERIVSHPNAILVIPPTRQKSRFDSMFGISDSSLRSHPARVTHPSKSRDNRTWRTAE